jgi:hypothetical protein
VTAPVETVNFDLLAKAASGKSISPDGGDEEENMR